MPGYARRLPSALRRSVNAVSYLFERRNITMLGNTELSEAFRVLPVRTICIIAIPFYETSPLPKIRSSGGSISLQSFLSSRSDRSAGAIWPFLLLIRWSRLDVIREMFRWDQTRYWIDSECIEDMRHSYHRKLTLSIFDRVVPASLQGEGMSVENKGVLRWMLADINEYRLELCVRTVAKLRVS